MYLTLANKISQKTPEENNKCKEIYTETYHSQTSEI